MGVSIGIERIFSILEAQAQVLFENVYYLCQTFCSQTSYYHPELGTVVGMVRKKICTHLQHVHGVGVTTCRLVYPLSLITSSVIFGLGSGVFARETPCDIYLKGQKSRSM